jgi:CarD family transcriptional regulator
VTFKVGDKVIYPNHGLGIVERVEEKTILGTTCGFFHLRIVSNDTTVLVPVANVDGVGLRKAITDEEVEHLFSLLSNGKIDNHQNWKGRFKDNSDKMRTGSIYDMADVLKSLTFLSKSKSLSFREKRMLDRAKALIISEVSEVMRVKAVDIEIRVDLSLEKCFVVKAKNLARATARAKATKVSASAKANGVANANGAVRANGAAKANGTSMVHGAVKANGAAKVQAVKANGAAKANGLVNGVAKVAASKAVVAKTVVAKTAVAKVARVASAMPRRAAHA